MTDINYLHNIPNNKQNIRLYRKKNRCKP